MARQLPGHAEVAAARAAMNAAKAMHEAVHALDVQLDAFDTTGAWPAGGEALIDGYLARWPEHAPPIDLSLAERARALRAALVPTAHRDHDLEHALEKLLFDQYHALLDAPEWADVKAILEPLYAERQEMFQPLADLWHQRSLRTAGHQQVDALRAILTNLDPEAAANPDSRASVCRGISAALVRMVDTFGFTAPPAPPEEGEFDDAAWVGALDAWHAGERLRSAQIASDVDAQMARWDEINRTIEMHTG